MAELYRVGPIPPTDGAWAKAERERLEARIVELERWQFDALPLLHSYARNGLRTVGGADTAERLLRQAGRQP